MADQLVSLQNPTRLPDEIIICDDHSTDETFQLLNDFKESTDISIKIYQNNNRLGFIKNFEMAVSLFKSKLENFGKEKLSKDIADFLSTKNLVYRFLILTKWKKEGKYFLNFRQIFFGIFR